MSIVLSSTNGCLRWLRSLGSHSCGIGCRQYVYNTNVRRMGHAYNHSIETVIYNWPVRRGLGAIVAVKVYTLFGYTINALYSKFRPQGWRAMALFGLLLAGVWLWMESWSLLGRLSFQIRCLWLAMAATFGRRPGKHTREVA